MELGLALMKSSESVDRVIAALDQKTKEKFAYIDQSRVLDNEGNPEIEIFDEVKQRDAQLIRLLTRSSAIVEFERSPGLKLLSDMVKSIGKIEEKTSVDESANSNDHEKAEDISDGQIEYSSNEVFLEPAQAGDLIEAVKSGEEDRVRGALLSGVKTGLRDGDGKRHCIGRAR